MGSEGDTLPAGTVKAAIHCAWRPGASDGKQWSDPRDGTWKVVNGPPVITSVPPVAASLKEPIYVYAVVAKDPDGDAVAFSLKEGPSGMTVDPKPDVWLKVDRASLGAKRRAVAAAKELRRRRGHTGIHGNGFSPEKQL